MNSPAYRRPLNDKQIQILNTIYRFRFVSSPLIAQLLNIKPSKAHARLNILLDQNYIGRRYDASYRWQGKAASYHLLPKGADALTATDDKKFRADVLKRLVKDETRSERFINHWLNVLSIYCQLDKHYGRRLRFFTNTELVPYAFFIQPRPDAFIRLEDNNGKGEKQYFLDVIDDATPKFANQGRIRRYIEYSEEGEWESATNFELPGVILVCANPSYKNRVKRLVSVELEEAFIDDELTISVRTLEQIKTGASLDL